MTRKDFVLIAKAISDACAEIRAKEPCDQQDALIDGVHYATDFLTDALARTNERFDRAQFIAACDKVQS